MTEVLKKLPSVCGVGQHFQDLGHSFSLYGPPSWQITYTVEPRFNEPLFNEVLDITNDILCPGQSYGKRYGIEPRYNEPRCNEFFDITNIIWKPKRKIYLYITNYNVNTRQKINAEQINSHLVIIKRQQPFSQRLIICHRHKLTSALSCLLLVLLTSSLPKASCNTLNT